MDKLCTQETAKVEAQIYLIADCHIKVLGKLRGNLNLVIGENNRFPVVADTHLDLQRCVNNSQGLVGRDIGFCVWSHVWRGDVDPWEESWEKLVGARERVQFLVVVICTHPVRITIFEDDVIRAYRLDEVGVWSVFTFRHSVTFF